MSLYSTYSLVRDVLFRAGEPTDGTSEFHNKVVDLLNKAQEAVCAGGAEILDGVTEEWDWLKKYPPGVLILEPANSRSATFTSGSADGTFAVAPGGSFGTGWFIKTPTGRSYRIISHNAGETAFTLDSAFIEASGVYTITVMKFEYGLAADVHRIVAPMRMHGVASSPDSGKIEGSSVDQMTSDFGNVPEGTPTNFALIGDQRVRMSHCLPSTASKIRVEYDYLVIPTDLVDLETSAPLLPKQHRILLSHIALMWLWQIKNDSRAGDAKALAQSALLAMARENKRSRSHYGPNYGQLRRPGVKKRQVLRTESGLIIG